MDESAFLDVHVDQAWESEWEQLSERYNIWLPGSVCEEHKG